ncbi:MAG: hypothetical protein R3B96_11740 [Pirellulaceae bacterium]
MKSSLSRALLLLGVAASAFAHIRDRAPGVPSRAAFSVRLSAEVKTIGSIERVSEEIDQLIPADSVIEVLAEGFEWSEGPVWVPQRRLRVCSPISHAIRS